MNKKTIDKYKIVVDEWFVNGFNGTKAYQKFYPKSSYETAKVEYSKIITIDEIEVYIQLKYKQSQEALKTSHEALLSELERYAERSASKSILNARTKETIR